MTPPSEPSPGIQPQPDPSQPATDEAEFEHLLEEVEQALVALKERYAQVQGDRQLQAELQQSLKEVKQEWHRTHLPSLQAELQRIKEQLETIELNLESRLFSWGSLKEPFWQAVRFAGLGVVVGWILAFQTLQSGNSKIQNGIAPPPTTQNSPK